MFSEDGAVVRRYSSTAVADSPQVGVEGDGRVGETFKQTFSEGLFAAVARGRYCRNGYHNGNTENGGCRKDSNKGYSFKTFARIN